VIGSENTLRVEKIQPRKYMSTKQKKFSIEWRIIGKAIVVCRSWKTPLTGSQEKNVVSFDTQLERF
jgi:hypothetical protein